MQAAISKKINWPHVVKPFNFFMVKVDNTESDVLSVEDRDEELSMQKKQVSLNCKFINIYNFYIIDYSTETTKTIIPLLFD